MDRYRLSFRRLGLLAATAALVSLGALRSVALATQQAYARDQIEAAFLYRFAGFVTWPEGALDSRSFTIDVLGDDAVASDLQTMLLHKQLQGRRAQVRRIASIAELGNAQILYIGESDARILRRWLAEIADRPVLVVTSQAGGLDDGSVINFLVVDRHVRFEVSLAAARRSGLAISAGLLSVATHIEGGPMGLEPSCETQPAALRELHSCPPRLASR